MMTSKIDKIIQDIIRVEGGYVNHPYDKGGPTCWGVTEAVARKHGYSGEMKFLPKEVAFSIYYEDYVVLPNFDKVISVDEDIAAELVDSGVNLGVKYPCLWLQQTLNVSNMMQKLYPDLKEDGDIGPITLSALQTLLAYRKDKGKGFVLKCLNVLQGARYFEITKARERNESFFFGWLDKRVVV